MINNTGWKYIKKLTNGFPSSTNVLYVPTISPELDKMCMYFTEEPQEYMEGSCVPRTKELMDYFFQRELNYLRLFQGKPWCPIIYDVDEQERKILIEFNKESLNWSVYEKGRFLGLEHPTWKDDLFSVIKDIYDLGYYKASLYTHCFFYTDSGQLKMIDYYATIDKTDSRIHKSLIEPIIGADSHHRFIEVRDGDYFEMGEHFKNSLKTWIKWPDDPFPEFYDRIFK